MATDGITIHYADKYKKHYFAITLSAYTAYCIITFSLWCWGYGIIEKLLN
jgi:hypothetical protein